MNHITKMQRDISFILAMYCSSNSVIINLLLPAYLAFIFVSALFCLKKPLPANMKKADPKIRNITGTNWYICWRSQQEAQEWRHTERKLYFPGAVYSCLFSCNLDTVTHWVTGGRQHHRSLKYIFPMENVDQFSFNKEWVEVFEVVMAGTFEWRIHATISEQPPCYNWPLGNFIRKKTQTTACTVTLYYYVYIAFNEDEPQ